MFKSILLTAFYPPKLTERMHVRERCVQKMMAAREKRLILMRAGAGFGKTSMLAFFYERLMLNKLWLSIPEGTFTCDKFVIHLFYGIMQKLEESSQKRWEPTWQRVAIGAVNLDEMVTHLINMMADLPGELYLFIDDFQYLRLQDVERDLQALQMLTRFAAQKIHFVIASREELPIPVNRFRMENQMLELREEELAFDRHELTYFLKLNGITLDETCAASLFQKTEGWIAGVCLLIYFYGARLNDPEGYKSIPAVKEYLDEILAGIGEKTKEFLRKTCIFDMISVSICNEYLGIEDCQRILDELVESQLLTYRYDDNGVSYYRYHKLLQEFFLNQLEEEERKANHLRLVEVYEAREQAEMVVTHLIQAGENVRAIDLIKREASRIIASSDVNLLTEWLDDIAALEKEPDPVLDLYRGRVRETRGHLDEAQKYYLKAEPGLRASGDIVNWIVVRIQIAGIYWWKGEYDRTLQICEETLPHVPDDKKSIQAGLLNLMGTSSMSLRLRSKGIEYLMKARELAHLENDIDGESWILNNLGFNGYLPQGKIAEAIEAYEAALANFRKVKNRQGMALVMSNLAYVYLIQQDLEKAEELVAEAEELYMEMNNMRSIRSVWVYRARIETLRGQYATAEELLLKTQEHLQSDDTHVFLGLFAVGYMIFYMSNGDAEKAREWMIKASEHIDKCDDLSPVVQEMHLVRVAFHLQYGEYEKAIERAEGIVLRAKEEKYMLTLLEASMLLAIAQKEHLGKVDPKLERTIKELDQGPYAFLQKKHANLLAKLGSSSAEKEGAGRVAANGAMVTQVHFFGKFMIKHNGKTMTMEDWTNRKALDLLKYLLLHHNHWVKQEDILENFWPATDVEKGKQTLYVALYTIRRKLGPDMEKSKEAIQTKKGMYRIQLPEPYWLDTEVFSEYAGEGLHFFRERSFLKAVEFLEQAKKVYRGDFLEENLYDEWTQEVRENYLETYLSVLTALAQIRGESGDCAGAVELLHEALAKNPFQDQLHREMMRYLVQAGRVHEAVQHYREYSEMYREELGVDLPEVVRRQYQQLLR